MNGYNVKKLLVSNKMDLNKLPYFENDRIYNISDIPHICVDKNILLEKLCEKYGEQIGKYIIEKTYPDSDKKVDPTEILNLLKNE